MEANNQGFLNRIFKFSENKTNLRTELIAGLTTFMTMAYILIVNPNFLSATGMEKGALFTATAISAAFATIIMAILTNYPFALAPGMGLNAFFAFVVAAKYGWQAALTAVLIEGLIFILLTLVNFREALINAIPMNIKRAVGVGIGLFITFIGLKEANIVVNDKDVLVGLGDMTDPKVLLTFFGIIITGFLVYRKVKGSLLFGILITYLLGVIVGVADLPSAIISSPPSLSPIFWKFDFSFTESWSKILDFSVIVFSFLFVDLFDTIGTLIGVSSKAGYLTKEGKLPKAKNALMADAIGTTAGAMLGTSTVTTYIESASGVAEGGRTGLTSLTTGLLFLVALVFSPVLTIIPSFATSPILVIVGLFMMEQVAKVEFTDYTESIPAFLTIIGMPLTYSIADGLMFGVISYILLKLVTAKFKDIHPVMYVIGLLFVLKFALPYLVSSFS